MNTVLILGARSDIAQALARGYMQEGDTLILAARHASQLSEVVSDLEIRYGSKAHAVEFDALDYESHPDFYAHLPARPDIVICVFGFLGDADTARQDFTEASRIVNTNYTGAVSILGLVANEFEERGSGTIVGISSVAGERGRQSNYIYGSAKAGFSTFLAGLRNRLYPSGVHVLTVKPGFVATQMTEGMNLPGALTATSDQVAGDVMKAVRKKKNVIYTLWMWRYVMFVIRSIPEFLFKKLSM